MYDNDAGYAGVWRNQQVPSPIQSVSDHMSFYSIDDDSRSQQQDWRTNEIKTPISPMATLQIQQPKPNRPYLQGQVLSNTTLIPETPVSSHKHKEPTVEPLQRRKTDWISDAYYAQSPLVEDDDDNVPPPLPSRSTQPTRSASMPISRSLSKKEDPRSNRLQRFIGDMGPMRLGRAGLTTLTSTAKYPYYFSPWGDNSPITLPNVRKREFVIGAAAHVTFGALDASSLGTVGKVLHRGVKMASEHFAEHGLDMFGSMVGRTNFLSPDGRANVKNRAEGGILSVEIRIKHRLMNESARLHLIGERETEDKRCCARAWFFPYLYASGRTPELPRHIDFYIAEFTGPGLAADAAVAPTILGALKDTLAPIYTLCGGDQDITIPSLNYDRVAVMLIGLSAYRGIWSQSRKPGEAHFYLHTFTHVPALILPVRIDRAPVMAWTEWTLEGMTFASHAEECVAPSSSNKKKGKVDMDLAYGEMPHEDSLKQRKYDLMRHAGELDSYLGGIVDSDRMSSPDWRNLMHREIREILEMAMLTPRVLGWDLGDSGCDMKRVGIAILRY